MNPACCIWRVFVVLFFLTTLCPGLGGERGPEVNSSRLLEIHSLTVNGQPVSIGATSKLRLGATPRNVTFGFNPATNSGILRLRFKLDGFDDNWREAAGEMTLAVRFIDANLEQVGETTIRMVGETEGWTGHPETCAFIHRRQTLVVPPGANALWVALSSAGPPNTVGMYVLTNLVLTRTGAAAKPPAVLLRWAADPKAEQAGPDWVPLDWVRSGLRAGMAKTTMAGPNQAFPALMLMDDDPTAHAEWTTRKEAGVAVNPGEHLELNWDEAYSIGLAGAAEVTYPELPAGLYRFRVKQFSLAGLPGQAETTLALEVPLTIWKTPWFWGLALLLILLTAAGTYRYVVWRHMRLALARLESQRALEFERLRIARDIHDDLGARVTQISLVSGLAQNDQTLSDKARADFNTISSMARELVSALYETVWAVNPENDNLDALGNYICQMVDNLCEKAQLSRRLRLAELPRDIQVSSNIRHNLILAVKEAVHNVIKHAKASEVSVHVELDGAMLSIRVEDNGVGFALQAKHPGNGVANMEQRLKQIGGSFVIKSHPGGGTTVTFNANVTPPR